MDSQEMSRRIREANGFIAALDQSGGSTPKALAGYGVAPGSWADDAEMFELIHRMRCRVITSPAFNGDKVLGAIERRAPDGEWRTNVAIGGSATPFELPDEWAQLAVRAANVVGADYAGVDLLPSRDGRIFVLEVNGIPGWEGFQRATGIDVAGAIVDQLVARMKARRALIVEEVE